MTVIEHLTELRYRLIVSLTAIVVGGIVAYALYDPILELLLSPLDDSGSIGGVEVDEVYVPGITTAFFLRMKVSAYMGLVFALPVTLYQFWRFITPGLHPREKRFAIPFVASALVLFGIGAWIAFAMMPVSIKFLLGFVGPAEPLIQLTEYLNFVIYMTMGFGLSFEFPLVLVFLGMLGVLPSSALTKRRRVAFLLAFLVAALATPSGDPLSQTILAVPLYILYEVSILVIRYGLKR